MMAKWYQKAMALCPPRKDFRKLAMPMAKVVAPPVRETMVFSPMSEAAFSRAAEPS